MISHKTKRFVIVQGFSGTFLCLCVKRLGLKSIGKGLAKFTRCKAIVSIISLLISDLQDSRFLMSHHYVPMVFG